MMTAYDTTTDDEDDEYIPAGAIILSGLVELMETDFERVMSAGLAHSSKLRKRLWLQRLATVLT